MLDWIGNIFLVVGSFLLGYRLRRAFLLIAFGEFVWLFRSYQLGSWDMLFICALFLILAIKNYIDWGRETPLFSSELVTLAMAAVGLRTRFYVTTPNGLVETPTTEEPIITDEPNRLEIGSYHELVPGRRRVVSVSKKIKNGKWAYKTTWSK